MSDYVIKVTDESFDYHSPWGTATQKVLKQHGFEFNKEKGMESFKGFGDYEYLNEIKDIERLICEIDLILLQDYTGENASTETEIENVMEELRAISILQDERTAA